MVANEKMLGVALNYDLIVAILVFIHPQKPTRLHLPERVWILQAKTAGVYTYLAKLCLVSRLWFAASRNTLYRIIPDLTYNPESFAAFIRTVREVPEIRPFVRRIHVLSNTSSVLTADNFADLGVLPRCVLIVPSTSWQYGPSAEIIPRLEALGQISVEKPKWTAETWLSAFKCWSRLEKLRIIISPENFPSFTELVDDNGSPLQLLPSLRTLCLSGIQHNWVIPPLTPNTLNTIILQNCLLLAPSPFIELLQQHSVSLRRIYVHGAMFKKFSGPVLDDIPLYATSLTRLFIRNAYGAVTDKILSQLPQSVEEVEISLNLPIPPKICLKLITERAPTLRHVQVSMVNSPSFPVRRTIGWRSWMLPKLQTSTSL
jgi:hypothetical protein